MGECFKEANSDDNIKVILIHGGRNYSSGNNVGVLSHWISLEHQECRKLTSKMIIDEGATILKYMNASIKPIVAVVRGICVGIAFTMMSMFDFVYVSPDAYFVAPFIQSLQSPEGSSTYNFPKITGPKIAN